MKAPPLALPADELRSSLLQWWGTSGRHRIPWKLKQGMRPAPGDPLEPYPIWVAEVK